MVITIPKPTYTSIENVKPQVATRRDYLSTSEVCEVGRNTQKRNEDT